MAVVRNLHGELGITLEQSLGKAQLLKQLLRHDVDRRAVVEQGDCLVSMNLRRADANGEPNKIG